MLSEKDMVEMLRARIAELGSQRALARELGISEAHLSDILNGNRRVSESVANALGFTMRLSYFPIKEVP